MIRSTSVAIAALGISTSLLAVGLSAPAHAGCDQTVPQSTAVTLDPSSVDASLGDVPVTCSIVVSDLQSGVRSATCHVRSMGDPRGLRSCTTNAPSSGDRQTGTFSCTVTIPRYAPSGVWPGWIDLVDQAGNLLQLKQVSPPLSVTSSPTDLAAPLLNGLQFSPNGADVSSVDRSIECTMNVRDVLSGARWARCSLWSPPGSVTPFQISNACETTTLASGTPIQGTFRCNITLPKSSPAGTWQVRVDLADRADNETFYMGETLTSRGLPSTLQITSNPNDVTGPQLVALDLVQNFGDTSTAAASTLCTARFTDNLSGVTRVVCRLSADGVANAITCESSTPVSGTPYDGEFACTLQLPVQAPAGLWTAAIESWDRVGAVYRTFFPLDRTRFDSEYTNSCGQPLAPIVRFQSGNDAGVIWTRLDGALRFDVYRGIVAGLIDENTDGRADDYGACRNHLDPDLTDGAFTDPGVPLLSERAFTYLIGWRDSSGNRGIGETSAGLPRQVDPTCP